MTGKTEIVRTRGGWCVTGESWSGPWKTEEAARLAMEGDFDGAHRAALAAATGTAKTAVQAECEASQSGGSASERNAQTQSSTPDNKDKPNA